MCNLSKPVAKAYVILMTVESSKAGMSGVVVLGTSPLVIPDTR